MALSKQKTFEKFRDEKFNFADRACDLFNEGRRDNLFQVFTTMGDMQYELGATKISFKLSSQNLVSVSDANSIQLEFAMGEKEVTMRAITAAYPVEKDRDAVVTVTGCEAIPEDVHIVANTMHRFARHLKL